MAKKTFILDTNVLIHDPDAFTAFGDNFVVLPMAVIEELDNLKKLHDERGRAARNVSRKLNQLAEKGKFNEGITLENGGILIIELEQEMKLPYDFSNSKKDNLILCAAYNRQKKGENVTFITKDINLRIKAEVLNIKAQDYEKEKIKMEELYQGYKEIIVDAETIDKFYKNKSINPPATDINKLPICEYTANEFVILKDIANPSKSALAKYDPKTKMLISLIYKESPIWGLKPLNIDEKIYRRLLVGKSVTPVGKDIGYLPGTKEEKMSQWMGSIYDNLEYLVDKSNPDETTEDKVQYFFDSGKIEIEVLAYLRGRSLPKQYIVIDDAQNLTPHEIKTIISRAGEGSKVVLTGDPYQIDNPYLDAESNGLTYL